MSSHEESIQDNSDAGKPVLGQAQKTLKAFRRACQLADHPKVRSKHQTK